MKKSYPQQRLPRFNLGQGKNSGRAVLAVVAATFFVAVVIWFFGVRAFGATTTVFILKADASPWTVPLDWNQSRNQVQLIGGGGGGRAGGNSGSGGGGGGAYSIIENISTLGATAAFQVGGGGTGGVSGGTLSGTAGTDTWFNGAGTICNAASQTVCAKGGNGATSVTGAIGGLIAGNVPASVGANGGNGGTGDTNGDSGGGGAGAGGVNGAGGTGGIGFAGGGGTGGGGGGTGLGALGTNGVAGGAGNGVAGNGGDNYLGTGHGTGGNAANGTAGSAGGGGGAGDSGFNGAVGGDGATSWTRSSNGQTAGSGGGGGGTGDNASGGTALGGSGGIYGGGGGGGASGAGSGTNGIIVVQYTPFIMPYIHQAAYTWFANSASTSPGNASTINTPLDAPPQGTPFRLRLLLHVQNGPLEQNGTTTKLQFAQKVGPTCDAPGDESYSNLTAATAIRFYDNPSLADNLTIGPNPFDPRHASTTANGNKVDNLNLQNFNDGGTDVTFTNAQSAIPAEEDGLWDFSLVDFSATPNTRYCIISVQNGGGLHKSYGSSTIPELRTAQKPKVILRGTVRLRKARLF